MNLKERLQTKTIGKKTIKSLSNEAYYKVCDERLDQRVGEITKIYQDSASEAWQHYVR